MRVYRMADTCFGLETVHTAIHRQLRDYAVESPAELTIRTTEADIAQEQERFPEPMVPAYAESLAVCRRLSDALLDRDVLLFHGSAVAVDGEVYLFTAPSGTGKSTHARLWREQRGPPSVYSESTSNRSLVFDPKFPVGCAPGTEPPLKLSWYGPSEVISGTVIPPAIRRSLMVFMYSWSLA